MEVVDETIAEWPVGASAIRHDPQDSGGGSRRPGTMETDGTEMNLMGEAASTDKNNWLVSAQALIPSSTLEWEL